MGSLYEGIIQTLFLVKTFIGLWNLGLNIFKSNSKIHSNHRLHTLVKLYDNVQCTHFVVMPVLGFLVHPVKTPVTFWIKKLKIICRAYNAWVIFLYYPLHIISSVNMEEILQQTFLKQLTFLNICHVIIDVGR